MSKRPQRPFRDARDNREAEPPDPMAGNKLRDQSNAQLRPSPSGTASSRPNQAPPGSVGQKENLIKVPEPPKLPAYDFKEWDWTHGTLPSKGPEYRFSLKLDEFKTPSNLEGGKIEKLVLFKNNQPVANFDQGWNIEPRDSKDRDAVLEIKTHFNGRERDSEPIVPRDHDKDRDRGMDR